MRIEKSSLPDLLFMIFLLCVVAGHVAWLKTDNSIRGNDSPNHLLTSIEFFYRFSEAARSQSPLIRKLQDLIKIIGTPVISELYWPHGVNLTAFIFYSLLGKSLVAAKMAILPYLLILLISTYSIGKLMYSKSAGFTAALLLYFYPIIFQSSRQYQLDLPLTAFVSLIIYFLLRCDLFKNTKYSFLLGLAGGIAMLIKGQVLLFVGVPFAYVLCRLSRERGAGAWRAPFETRQLGNLLAALLISFLIASIWWGFDINGVVALLTRHIFDPAKNLERTPYSWDNKYSLGSIFFHLRSLFYSSLRPFFSLLLISLFPFYLTQKTKYKALLANWIIPPLLLFSLVFTIKHSRFLMPILPAFALMTASGLFCIKNRKARLLVLFVSVIFSLLQFYILSYGDYRNRLVSIGRFRIFGSEGFGSDYETRKPHNQDLKIDMVGSVIRRHRTAGDLPRVLLIDMCTGRPQYAEMLFWLKMQGGPLVAADLVNAFENWPKGLDSADFIVYYNFLDSPTRWYEAVKHGNAFENDYFNDIKIFEASAKKGAKIQAWENFLYGMENAGPNYSLIGKVSEAAKAYYIYKRGRQPSN